MPELVMPKMGDSMEEGTLLSWLKKEGDQVAEQEVVAEIQTEKATIEIPSVEAGILTKILVQEGETVPVGTPIAVVGEASAKPASAKPGSTKPTETKPEVQVPLAGKTPPAVQQDGAAPSPAANGQRVKASPLAKKVAHEHGVDLRAVRGTGPGGRIIEADVEAAMRTAPAAAPAVSAPLAQAAPAADLAGTQRPMSPMRKIIARRLTQSKQTIPHFYLTLDVDMRAAAKLRGEYNAGAGEERRISFNDLVVRACVLSLEKFPALRSQLDGETIRVPDSVNVGVAVALEEGLVVTVIKEAQNKSVSTVGRETRALAEKARNGQLTPEDYSGGVFTVSNLGMFDVTMFQAIINPPETAIVAVAAIRDT
ncbi:MAG: dihydrolipoamide acetyltransferase family protein, partial [Actinomycetota bacterium]